LCQSFTADELAAQSSGSIVARVGDRHITADELEERWSQLPKPVRSMYARPGGPGVLLTQMIHERLLIFSAQDSIDLSELRDKPDELRAAAMDFWEERIRAAIDLSEVRLRAYFEDHKPEYERPERVRARHFCSKSMDEAIALRERLREGAPADSLPATCFLDSLAALRRGRIGYLTRQDTIPRVPGSGRLVAAAFTLQAGEVSEPLPHAGGYHLVLIEERQEGKSLPFEELAPEIEGKVYREGFKQAYIAEIQALKDLYPVEIDSLIHTVSFGRHEEADNLFLNAQTASSSTERLAIYQDLLDRFGDTKYGCQAAFMIGFVYAEELLEYEKARDAFGKMIDRFPECDLVESARWMLENMEREDTPWETK
jgi:hypothetical protein